MAILGLGAVTLGREVDETTSLLLLDAAWERGLRHFDTAEAYGGGNARQYRAAVLGVDDVREATGILHSSEILLGRWLAARGLGRTASVATKVSSGFRAAEIRAALEASLRRLQLERVDLYYLHSLPRQTPLEEALEALSAARRRGEIGRIGVSNATAADLALVRQACPEAAVCQAGFSLAHASRDLALRRAAASLGFDFVGYSPLAGGFLTGKYGPRGERIPPGSRFDVIPGHRDVYFSEECFTALARLQQAAAETGLPAAGLALAWALRAAGDATLLIGATRVGHLDQALDALALAGTLAPQLDALAEAA